MRFKHMKDRCAGCERIGVPMNKEHPFPQWLIKRTGTDKTGIRWADKKRIPALAVTVPLCVDCNTDFGKYLEAPMAALFDDIESGRGVSDSEAELLVRWLWKIEGLMWVGYNPGGDYSDRYTLRERILRPLDDMRGHLAIAVSRLRNIDPEHGDQPMGLDSGIGGANAIFVSGVFARIAVMVLVADFADRIPPHFSVYRLANKPDALANAKVFFPKDGFEDDNEAVFVTKMCSTALLNVHEELAVLARQREATPR
jgi:hypothetical protein